MTTNELRNLVPGIQASLEAKIQRKLERPIIARVMNATGDVVHEADDEPTSGIFRVLRESARAYAADVGSTRVENVWRVDPSDETCTVRIAIDYDDRWRGDEKLVLQAIEGAVESQITFLTDAQKMLLEQSPREFLASFPPPESVELLAFKSEKIGGSIRVVELKLASAPESPAHVHHLAIIPNLVQLERQLDGLRIIEAASDDGPLSPLRALVGLCDPACLATSSTPFESADRLLGERLDESQSECVRKAVTTPHFAVIQGPPGSGKTTVITSVIRRALNCGERVLVVSPTHVAVDNVVEKLAVPVDHDALDAHSLPVRYAAKDHKLSARACEYWVGSQKQARAATISRRIERRLIDAVPIAAKLYSMEDKNASGRAPLSAAVSDVEQVVCGTPIGILSYEIVKNAAPGAFDLLVVDEVSKMTVLDFLAVAVKARRWVLVGDPEQLPPFNDCEENAPTLDDVIDPEVELVCSVASVVGIRTYEMHAGGRLVVIAKNPTRVATAIRAHLYSVMGLDHPRISTLDEEQDASVIVCTARDVEAACEALTSVRDLSHNPQAKGTVWLLTQRGVDIERPAFASGLRLVRPADRAQARIFDACFHLFHAQPWSLRSEQQLTLVTRSALRTYLPSDASIMNAIAERFAINAVSVYDWLTGLPTEKFDVSPLVEMTGLRSAALYDAVQPYVGVLEKQYRMHPSLSRVPRELFYFSEALHDGNPGANKGHGLELVQVAPRTDGESNAEEVDVIRRLLRQLNESDEAKASAPPEIMVITPYGEQERELTRAFRDMEKDDEIARLKIEVCTLDRCQGREADYVLISLVRSRSSAFMNMPKRWNVALTRAKRGLLIVGNIHAFRDEARKARRYQRRNGGTPPIMSVLARVIEAYDRQIMESQRRFG